MTESLLALHAKLDKVLYEHHALRQTNIELHADNLELKRTNALLRQHNSKLKNGTLTPRKTRVDRGPDKRLKENRK